MHSKNFREKFYANFEKKKIWEVTYHPSMHSDMDQDAKILVFITLQDEYTKNSITNCALSPFVIERQVSIYMTSLHAEDGEKVRTKDG